MSLEQIQNGDNNLLEQNYHKRRAQFITRAIETVVKQNAEPEKIDSDGRSQLVVARQDEPQLTHEGMDPALITEVEETLQAFMWIATLCDMKIASKNDNAKLYQKIKAQTYELRRLLFKYGKFGCKRNGLTEAYEKLLLIIEGAGDEDLINDMLELYHLFKNNPEIPTGLKQFDPSWIDQAFSLNRELGDLRAVKENPDVESEIIQLEREVKQAYDLYHEKLEELREWGEFVFEGTERAAAYRSIYMQERLQKAWKKRRADEETTTTEQ